MELSTNQIENGFWYYRPEENFPPEGKTLDAYKGESSFSFLITSGNESKSQILNRERNYVYEIPITLKKVKILWASYINQEVFDSICKLPKLKALFVQSNRIKDISSIINLVNLKHLAIVDFTKIVDISSLSNCPNLRTLQIENMKRISDFSGLGKLNKLQGLEIDGSMYSVQKIDDFEFIESLNNLEYLTLVNTRAKKKDFTPLTNLVKLKMFQCSQNYPKAEFRKLSILPELRYFGNVEKLIKS